LIRAAISRARIEPESVQAAGSLPGSGGAGVAVLHPVAEPRGQGGESVLVPGSYEKVVAEVAA